MKQSITILGNGNMALAIARGLSSKYILEIVGRNISKLDDFETNLNLSIKKTLYQNLNAQDKTIILCVKPTNIIDIKLFLNKQAKSVYSVLAGVSIETIKQHLDAKYYVRVMPNLAANIKKSMTTLTGSLACKDEAIEIFKAIGSTLWVNSQKELDIATALAGSGPAYLCLIAEALADGAVKQGLKRDDAMTLMKGLFAGFGEVIQNIHPALLKDAVMSAGGTTAAGYSELESKGVRSGCINAIQAAYEKTKL